MALFNPLSVLNCDSVTIYLLCCSFYNMIQFNANGSFIFTVSKLRLMNWFLLGKTELHDYISVLRWDRKHFASLYAGFIV